MLWNVRYARLFVFHSGEGEYVLHTEWADLDDITTRAAVRPARLRWEALGAKILRTVNALFADGSLEGRPFIEAYRSGGPSSLVLANAEPIAEAFRYRARSHRDFRSELTLWWDQYRNEYDGDDPYAALARANLLNWTGKFLFAHVLRERDDRA